MREITDQAIFSKSTIDILMSMARESLLDRYKKKWGEDYYRYWGTSLSNMTKGVIERLNETRALTAFFEPNYMDTEDMSKFVIDKYDITLANFKKIRKRVEEERQALEDMDYDDYE